LYIADCGNNRIRKVFNGMISTVVVGNCSQHSVELVTPSSVFVSKSGEIYICEQNGHRIKKVDSNGIISTIAGTGFGGYIGHIGLEKNT